MIRTLYDGVDLGMVLCVAVLLLWSYNHNWNPHMYKRKWALYGGLLVLLCFCFKLVERLFVGRW